MKQLQDASKQLMDNLIFALNHCMELKKDGVDPMIPFAVVVKDKDKKIKAFAGDTADYGDQMFEKTVEDEKPDIVIYASDSYLTTDGIKYDAILLKAYDKNDSEVYLVGQKFKPKTESEEFEQIGNPGFLGTLANPYALNTSFKNVEVRQKKPRWKIW
jgi:hypothetical protein